MIPRSIGCHARATRLAMGRVEEETAYVRGLRAKHGRKYTLMELLKPLEYS